MPTFNTITPYYTSITVICMVALLILCILVHENARMPQPDKRLFYLTYLVIAAAAIAEYIGVFLNGKQEYPAVYLRIAKCLDYTLTPMAGAMFIEQLKMRNIWRRIIFYSLTLNTVFQIISIFSGWSVRIDEYHIYSEGPLYWIYVLIYVIITVLTILQFILYGKQYKNQNRASLFLMLVFVFLGIGLQEILGGDVRTAYLGLTISSALLFIHCAEFTQLEADEKLLEQKMKLRETQALKDAMEAAEEASRAKSDFLANMSHEFRTPINAVLGMNEMIQRESTDETILAYSSNIKSAGNTLLGLINDVLDFSQIEEGKLEITPAEYDISSMLNDLVNMTHIRTEDKGLTLYLDFDKNLPRYLYGDETRIRQIFTNILSNAVKYTEAGSVTFSIDFERTVDDPESVLLRVSVQDTGIGIREEDMEKIFAKFERLEKTKNHSTEGTGLGLSITKRLLEMMGSKLQANSTYGKGSEFFFVLRQKVVRWEPLGEYKSTWLFKTEKKKKQGPFTAEKASILLIDDNPLNLAVFKSLLKRIGSDVETALSGDEGLALTRTKQFDLIYLDHMMPEKDGIETLEELRSESTNPNLHTPVICLTANAVKGAREEYLAAGFDEYMSKPIETDRLEESLLRFLPKSKIKYLPAEYKEPEETPEEKNDDAILELLPPNCGINIETGIKNSGSVHSYLQLLNIFYDSIDRTYDELDRLYEDRDMKNYTIKVHALKSSARIIGAIDFGEAGQALEDAGKRDDVAFINAHHPSFMSTYESFRPLLAKLFPEEGEDEESKPEVDLTLLHALYEDLSDAAEDMDCDKLEELLKQMESMRFPEEEKERAAALKEAIMQYDYDKVLKLVTS